MKRAAIVFLAIASLVMTGSPSISLMSGSPCYAATTKTDAGPGVVAPASGGAVTTGGSGGSNSGGGDGTSAGDADGLSGVRAPKLTPSGLMTMPAVERVAVIIGTWWKLVIWMR